MSLFTATKNFSISKSEKCGKKKKRAGRETQISFLSPQRKQIFCLFFLFKTAVLSSEQTSIKVMVLQKEKKKKNSHVSLIHNKWPNLSIQTRPAQVLTCAATIMYL